MDIIDGRYMEIHAAPFWLPHPRGNHVEEWREISIRIKIKEKGPHLPIDFPKLHETRGI